MAEPMTEQQIRLKVADVLVATWKLSSGGQSFEQYGIDFADALSEAGLLAKPGDQEVSEQHIIKYTATGYYTMMHPLACRPNLFGCQVWLTAQVTDGPPSGIGTYYCGLDEDGNLERYGEVVDSDG